MLHFSLAGIIFGLTVLGFAFFELERNRFTLIMGWIAMVALLVYRMAFSMGVGPVPMLLSSEIYPSTIRGEWK